MKGFKQFIEMQLVSQDPPTPKGDLSLKDHERLLLQTYLDKGAISQEDLDDIGKMIEGGWSFQDALSVVQQQANHRRQFQPTLQPSAQSPKSEPFQGG